MVYATKGNFTHHTIYRQPNCYLHRYDAKKLQEASKTAAKLGFVLKIYDAFRPFKAQKELWNQFPNLTFVADLYTEFPKMAHCRGVALDVTLVPKDKKIERELEMGTIVDFFVRESHTKCKDATDEAKFNRQILCNIILDAGFENLADEWRHFQLSDYMDKLENGSDKYPVLKGVEQLVGGIDCLSPEALLSAHSYQMAIKYRNPTFAYT